MAHNAQKTNKKTKKRKSIAKTLVCFHAFVFVSYVPWDGNDEEMSLFNTRPKRNRFREDDDMSLPLREPAITLHNPEKRAPKKNANNVDLWGFDLPSLHVNDKVSPPITSSASASSEGTDTLLGKEGSESGETQAILGIIKNSELSPLQVVEKWRETCVFNDGKHASKSGVSQIPLVAFESEDIKISKKDLKEMKLFSKKQVDKSWIIARVKYYLILVDQHAVDERIKLEEFTSFLVGANGPNTYRIRNSIIQPPVNIRLEPLEYEKLKSELEFFESWGVECKNGRNGVISVVKVSKLYGVSISPEEIKEWLGEMVDKNVTSENNPSFIPKCIKRLLASKACKAAVRFGETLSVGKMKELLEKLSVCKLPFQCAHGRPTMFPVVDLRKALNESDLQSDERMS